MTRQGWPSVTEAAMWKSLRLGAVSVCWQKKQTMERLLQEPAAWGIPAGPPMENPVKSMPIPIAVMTAMWSGYIMVLLRITRS